MIEKILNNIQKYLFFWLMLSVASGLFASYFFAGFVFSPLICILAAVLMIFPSLVPLAFDKLPQAFKHKKTILVSLVFNFIIAPSLAIVLGNLFLSDLPTFRLGLLLIALLPGGGMVTIWAHKSKADMLTTVGIVFTNLLAAVLIVPLGISEAMGRWANSATKTVTAEICPLSQISSGAVSCGAGVGPISPAKIIGPIVLIVVIPLILAYITQVSIKEKKGAEYFEKTKEVLGKISNVGLVIVLFVLMGLKENKILFENPDWILKAAIPLIIFYGINIFLIQAVYKKFYKNNIGKAFVWGTYLRYITLALGLAVSLVYQNQLLAPMIIIIVLAYFIQIPSSFWLAKKLQS